MEAVGFGASSLLLPGGAGGSPAAAAAAEGSSPDVTLAIEGMMCQKSCGATVQRALGAVPQVARASVSFEEGRARVWLLEPTEALGGTVQQVCVF